MSISGNTTASCTDGCKYGTKMTHWGVGPKFGIFMISYGAFVIVLNAYYHPFFSLELLPYKALACIGAALILLGIPFYLFSLASVMRAFKASRLVTTGAYGMCRHPVYASWVLFFTPGIALLMRSWLGLSVPVVMYFVLKALVKEEDLYLEKTFGDEYRAYKAKTPLVLPIGRFRPDK